MHMRYWLQIVFVISFVELEVFAAAHARPIVPSHNQRSYICNPMPIPVVPSIATAAVAATYSRPSDREVKQRPHVVTIKKLNIGAKCTALSLNISDEGHAGVLEYSLKGFATYSKAPVVGATGYARNALPKVRIDKLSSEHLDVERWGFCSSLTLPDADGIVVRLLFLYAGNLRDSQEGLEYLLVVTKSAQVDILNAYLYKKDAATDVEWKRLSFDEIGIEDNILEWKIISLLKRLMSLDVSSKNQRKSDFCDSKAEAAQKMLIDISQPAAQSSRSSTSVMSISQATSLSSSSASSSSSATEGTSQKSLAVAEVELDKILCRVAIVDRGEGYVILIFKILQGLWGLSPHFKQNVEFEKRMITMRKEDIAKNSLVVSLRRQRPTKRRPEPYYLNVCVRSNNVQEGQIVSFGISPMYGLGTYQHAPLYT